MSCFLSSFVSKTASLTIARSNPVFFGSVTAFGHQQCVRSAAVGPKLETRERWLVRSFDQCRCGAVTKDRPQTSVMSVDEFGIGFSCD